nr:MAG TPA: hypothetical protein [Caudoviricetes sp.]
MKQKIRYSLKKAYIKRYDKRLKMFNKHTRYRWSVYKQHIYVRKNCERYIEIHNKYGYADIF